MADLFWCEPDGPFGCMAESLVRGPFGQRQYWRIVEATGFDDERFLMGDHSQALITRGVEDQGPWRSLEDAKRDCQEAEDELIRRALEGTRAGMEPPVIAPGEGGAMTKQERKAAKERMSIRRDLVFCLLDKCEFKTKEDIVEEAGYLFDYITGEPSGEVYDCF